MTQNSPSFLSTPSFSASRDLSPSNKIIQAEIFTDAITNEVKLRKLKDSIINELRENQRDERDETHLSKTTQENPVEKFSKHPSIVSIKKRMEATSNKLSFKYEDRKKFLTEIQNRNSRKVTQ